MPKQMLCPSCKNAIIVDSQTLATAERIQCPTCNSSFKLKKKAAPPPEPEVLDAEVVEVVDTLPDEAGPLDLGSMNFNSFGAGPGGAVDNSFDPLAGPLAEGASTFGAAPGAYAPKKVEVPSKPPREPMSVGTKIVIALGSVGALVILACGTVGYLLVSSYMNLDTDLKRMKQISLAMYNYESTYKRFPAMAAIDSERKPAYSWTVAIIPYLDGNAHLKSFNYDTVLPWNAPGNELLQGDAPEVYRSARGNAKRNERNVFVLWSPRKEVYQNKALFDEEFGPKMAEMTDGTSNTILAIQLARHSKPWAEPGELTIDEAYDLIKKEPGIVLVAMADGTIVSLPITISRESFQGLATKSGGEIVRVDSIR